MYLQLGKRQNLIWKTLTLTYHSLSLSILTLKFLIYLGICHNIIGMSLGPTYTAIVEQCILPNLKYITDDMNSDAISFQVLALRKTYLNLAGFSISCQLRICLNSKRRYLSNLFIPVHIKWVKRKEIWMLRCGV